MDKNKKKTIALIIVVVVLVITFTLLTIGNRLSNSGGKTNTTSKNRLSSVVVTNTLIEDSTRRQINNPQDSDEICLNDYLCIASLTIFAYENEGVVSITLKNENPNSAIEADYVKLLINNNPIVLYHDSIASGQTYYTEIGYDGFDLRTASNVSLVDLLLDEYGNIISG